MVTRHGNPMLLQIFTLNLLKKLQYFLVLPYSDNYVCDDLFNCAYSIVGLAFGFYSHCTCVFLDHNVLCLFLTSPHLLYVPLTLLSFSTKLPIKSVSYMFISARESIDSKDKFSPFSRRYFFELLCLKI